jgi:hypothetical protein
LVLAPIALHALCVRAAALVLFLALAHAIRCSRLAAF